MAKEWNKNVNKNFYGLDGGYRENTENIEFKSGRVITYLKNSLPKKSLTVSLRCADTGTEKINGKTEFEHFLDWYESTIKSGTIPFYLEDLVTKRGLTQYMIVTPPTWNGQKYKEISLTLEEV